MDLYDRIDMLLKIKKSNKRRLCESTGISYNTLASLFKRRSKNMELETIRKIAAYLGTTVEYLFTGNEPENTGAPNNLVLVYDGSGRKLEYKLEPEQMQAILTFLESMKK